MRKMNKNKLYGYKLCYSEKGEKRKLKIHSILSCYFLAKIEKRYCERHTQYSKEDNHKLYDPTWYILPIKKNESKKLWKDSPFCNSVFL